MKINKNSTLYKIGVVVVIVLAIVYYLYTWNGTDTEDKGDNPTTEWAEGIENNTVETTYNREESEDSNNTETTSGEDIESDLRFRNQKLLDQHYEKHGRDMGFSSAEEYEAAAGRVVANKDTLHKIEEEDGDDVYYLEETNEFVVVSTDGYIRTYFNPDDGLDYYNRQ